MTSERFRCSEESLTLDEPLHATASLVSAWLLVEQDGAWGPDALFDSRFPDEIASQLARRAGGVRILLIRRRNPPDGDPLVFKAYSGGPDLRPILAAERFTDPSDLLAVDFEALAHGDPGTGEPVEKPLYLVCTHGRHDICCADKGRPLYRAMTDLRPEQTWEVSHLGGDRFAGNVLVLARGDYFGRLQPEDAGDFVAAYEAGRLLLDHYRGRSVHPRFVQAAEQYVRERDRVPALDGLAVDDYRRLDHDHAEVTFRAADRAVRVAVTAHQSTEPELLTCRAEQPGFRVRYEIEPLTV